MTQFAGTRFAVRLLGASAGALFLFSALAINASAQGLGGNGPIGGAASMQRRAQAGSAQAEKREAPPDVLPGAKARAPVAPASKTPSDMAPNEAMFDAINRGDLATVKDALSRGAHLQAHNILGMTPLELSIDLGRNDISFLLLSMRGDGGGPAKVAAGTAGRTLSQKTASPKSTEVTRPRGRAVPNPAQVATKPVSTPKLFANDGGSPQPNAGFLGFDSRGSTN